MEHVLKLVGSDNLGMRKSFIAKFLLDARIILKNCNKDIPEKYYNMPRMSKDLTDEIFITRVHDNFYSLYRNKEHKELAEALLINFPRELKVLNTLSQFKEMQKKAMAELEESYNL